LARRLSWRADHARFFVSRIFGRLGGNRARLRRKLASFGAGICRVFLAKVDSKGDEHTMQETACSDKRGEWTIAEAKPWKKT
jgi:hypothetical protein